MAIPKKGSRTIVVNELKFRWLIRQKPTYTQLVYGDGKLYVAIELHENSGNCLHIVTDRAHPEDIRTKVVIAITPSDVSNWIEQALKLGWNPVATGKPFLTIIENGELKLRRQNKAIN